MADNTTKTAAGVGIGLAVLGGLFAALGGAKKKPAPGMQGAGPLPRKNCNCGR